MAKQEQERTVFVVDTNVLLHDRGCLKKYDRDILVIPIWALEELDKFKKHQDELGANAREISREIEKIREQGSLAKGAPTGSGGLLFVDYNGTDFGKLPVGLLRNNDNRIILIAKAWQEKKDKQSRKSKNWEKQLEYADVIIVSKDINLRLKADACGIIAQDYLGDKTIARIELLYSGTETHILPSRKKSVLNDHVVRQQGIIPAKSLADVLPLDEMRANVCCRFEVEKTTVNAVYKKAAKHFRIERKLDPAYTTRKCLITPNNIEQRFAYELLMDPEISVVTLNGKAGSGKTLMALLAGYEQLEHVYDQLLVYRPCHEIGQPLGFRPGSTEEKFDPFTIPILDSMKRILDTRDTLCTTGQQTGKRAAKGFQELKAPKGGTYAKVRDLIEKGLLEIGPINYIRGRSIPNAFIVVDEAQNLTPLEIKTIISRAGEGTKVVLTGDVYQIDNPLVDSISNGLSHAIEKLKGFEIFGHITLLKCERSLLAELAAQHL